MERPSSVNRTSFGVPVPSIYSENTVISKLICSKQFHTTYTTRVFIAFQSGSGVLLGVRGGGTPQHVNGCKAARPPGLRVELVGSNQLHKRFPCKTWGLNGGIPTLYSMITPPKTCELLQAPPLRRSFWVPKRSDPAIRRSPAPAVMVHPISQTLHGTAIGLPINWGGFGDQWGGIHGSPMECLGITLSHSL